MHVLVHVPESQISKPVLSLPCTELVRLSIPVDDLPFWIISFEYHTELIPKFKELF